MLSSTSKPPGSGNAVPAHLTRELVPGSNTSGTAVSEGLTNPIHGVTHFDSPTNAEISVTPRQYRMLQELKRQVKQSTNGLPASPSNMNRGPQSRTTQPVPQSEQAIHNRSNAPVPISPGGTGQSNNVQSKPAKVGNTPSTQNGGTEQAQWQKKELEDRRRRINLKAKWEQELHAEPLNNQGNSTSSQPPGGHINETIQPVQPQPHVVQVQQPVQLSAPGNFGQLNNSFWPGSHSYLSQPSSNVASSSIYGFSQPTIQHPNSAPIFQQVEQQQPIDELFNQYQQKQNEIADLNRRLKQRSAQELADWTARKSEQSFAIRKDNESNYRGLDSLLRPYDQPFDPGVQQPALYPHLQRRFPQ